MISIKLELFLITLIYLFESGNYLIRGVNSASINVSALQNEEYNKSAFNINAVEFEEHFCGLKGTLESVNENNMNFTLSNDLFESKILVPGVIYQIKVNKRTTAPIDFVLTSHINGTSLGEFSTADDGKQNGEENSLKCDGIGKFRRWLGETSNEININWTFHRSETSDFFKSNLTFWLDYQLQGSDSIRRIIHDGILTKDCQLYLHKKESFVSDKDIPQDQDCEIWFPNKGDHGLIIELTRLNIPCSKGYIHFSGLNRSQNQHFKSHKQSHLCGKLEELSEIDRRIYFPTSHTPPLMKLINRPIFSISYHLVDYCYNITFVTKNGSFELKPTGDLMCTFKIYLPYGNRVALTLIIGDSTVTGESATSSFQEVPAEETKCDGLETLLYDGDNQWSHCTRSGDAERRIELVSRGCRVTLQVTVRGIDNGAIGLRMTYRAEPIEEIVGLCEFGWLAMRQFCLSVTEDVKLPWAQAETECVRKGGHLASIRSEHAQDIVDNLLLNSPEYRDDNAYWIGASDNTYEGDFRWSDGLPFSYSNWFSGWSQHGHYNRQPNDDGLSDQDCVEIRRVYSLPTSMTRMTNNFKWNDRDCSTPNYFICEKLQTDEPLEDAWPMDCNKTISLTRQNPRALTSSPGFPRQYPDNVDCNTYILAPPGYQILLDFEELVLENEPTCSYDYLEILETGVDSSQPSSPRNRSLARRLCGDWSAKLKLLRYVSITSKLILKFSSDYSHHFGGYKARVSMENAARCADDRHQIFNNSCYLFVSYPEVSWATAQHICSGIKSNLASILSPDEERFVITNLRKTPEYRTSALYWLGGKLNKTLGFHWIDNKPVKYLGWLPGEEPFENLKKGNETSKCLGVQWTPSPTPMLPSGLYWKSKRCNTVGGYVCKRANVEPGEHLNFNRTINGTGGTLISPNFPGNYYNNLEFTIKIIGPKRTRLVFKFDRIDVESQIECLYDYIELRSAENYRKKSDDVVKLCGSHDVDMHKFNFVSETNEAFLRFHSDYSISGLGYSLKWNAIAIPFCPTQTLTAKEGFVTSPNYPDFLLPHLNCTLTIQAPYGQKVWFDFLIVDFGKGNQDSTKNIDQTLLEIKLGEDLDFFRPFSVENLLTDGSFLSDRETFEIRLQTGKKPEGIGFKAHYKMIGVVQEQRNIFLNENSSGILLYLNYPNNPKVNVDFVQHFIAPLGSIISLELYNIKLTNTNCYEENGLLEIYDNYGDTNGTMWKLCNDPAEPNAILPVNRIEITSVLNTLHLRQVSGGSFAVPVNGSLKTQIDEDFKTKLMKFKNEVESCDPNPCRHGGKCIAKGKNKYCECVEHFTGMFCALTKCDLDPCVFGTCELTPKSYKCHCKEGYTGPTCEQKKKPCEGNPCESRGFCLEKGEGFICRCHAWWEGPRCEKRMLHIPYKPLSERMLHEPFWLGLMTVFVVMAVIGLVWCAKRHFPEKIEKLLAEEQERSRSAMSMRNSSMREQLAATTAVSAQNSVSIAPSPGPGAPRSLFGRLGIRKPSILSLTSPHASSGYSPATARTFSLDDLLKPLPRRSPSPKKKRNNSTPTKKNAAEKKQILQQLVSPNSSQLSRKVSLGELMQMSDRSPGCSGINRHKENQLTVKETKFIEDDATESVLTDPKLEKKVHFARLLNKVSAEMSSGSEIELGIMHSNRLGCAILRPSSSPPSPCIDTRSPNSTSSNQGSDSFSSDLALSNALSSSISDLLVRRHCTKFSSGKPTSADSILAMFRNFSSSSAGANLPPSLKVSPSTTPTASSPQDDIAGDDESSSSSIHTPVSFSSGAPESPVLHRHNPQSTIEISVLDTLSAHKSPTSGSNLLHPPTILLEIPSTINKCLSPIREMPTPLPSPIPSPHITPIMRRSAAKSSSEYNDLSDDRISVELPNISISCSDLDDDDMHRTPDNIDLEAEDGLIVEEVAAMHQNKYKTKVRLPPLGQTSDQSQMCPPPLMIPTLTVEMPSPTFTPSPSVTFPGSPPPHKKLNTESCFQFPPPSKQRKMLKEFDKPTSLDLPCGPPMITITCNMSEAESDAESISPAVKSSVHLGASTSGMSYLSPFSMGNRNEQHASESNLSSSGYSSMASPGPSRCGSSNPLCPSEMEDQGPPGSGHIHRRPSPILKTNTHSSESEGTNLNQNMEENERRRGRSDSETLSDDPLIESNDEGIGTDHLEEKIEEGEVKSAKDLEILINSESNTNIQTLIDLSNIIIPSPKCRTLDDSVERLLLPPPSCSSKNLLQLPSIVVQCDEGHLSPVSSRSESPLSDRTSKFSPEFFGTHRDLLPFTDSDGLYDFPSSGNSTSSTIVPLRKLSAKKREKKVLRNCKTPSPTKSFHSPSSLHYQLDIPIKDSVYKMPPPRKLSPKRRLARPQVMSSSSSSDSVTSTKEMKLSSSSLSPDTIRWSPSTEWNDYKKSKCVNCEESPDEASEAMLPKSRNSNTNQKLSRLKAIGHQIRFLRRLETSLKHRERSISPYDSPDSNDEDSLRATSPLLQNRGSKQEIRKSSSIGKLPSSSSQGSNRNRRGKYKRGDLLTAHQQESWKRVVVTGSGHSD